MSMAELKTVKSKTKKISASVTSALPKLSPKGLNTQEQTFSTASRTSRSVGSRSNSKEKKCLENRIDNGKIYKRSSKTTEKEKKSEVNGKGRTVSNTSLGSVSPGKHHSHIPVPSRIQVNHKKYGTGKRKVISASTATKSSIDSCERKTGHLRNTNLGVKSKSRSPSPPATNKQKTDRVSVESSRSKSPCSRISTDDNKVVRTEKIEQCLLSNISFSTENVPEGSLTFTKSYTTITLSSPRAESDIPPLDSTARESLGNSSTYTTEDLSPTDVKDVYASASVSRGSLSYDFDFQSCSGSQRTQPRCGSECTNLYDGSNDLQMETLDLCLDESDTRLNTTSLESPLSPERNERNVPDMVQNPQTTVRTLSGDELVFTSSMEFDIENDLAEENGLPVEHEEIIDKLLEGTEDDSFAKAFVGVHMAEDDTNEYDSDDATDADVPSMSMYAKSETNFANGQTHQSKTNKSEHKISEGPESRSSWRSKENELLMDVNYRQFVYHPTVLRRQTREQSHEDRDRPRSKSIEERCSLRLSDCERERGMRTSNTFKRENLSQTFVSNRDVNITPLRTWSEKVPQDEEREIYNRLHLMQNTDYVLKEIKRERSKRERITGAVLRLTAKFIHLLAILNLWPGDNCQLLTSHSLSYGRIVHLVFCGPPFSLIIAKVGVSLGAWGEADSTCNNNPLMFSAFYAGIICSKTGSQTVCHENIETLGPLWCGEILRPVVKNVLD